MANPGDPQRDRGYYGAGWSQPAPPVPPAPAQSAGAVPPYGGQPGAGGPYAPPRPPRRSRPAGDPRRAFAPGASVTNTTGALIAVVSLVLVQFVSGAVGLLGTALVVHPFSRYGPGADLLGSFTDGVFLAPFPFYAGAFLALAFLTPIARRSPLPTVLLRAVLAGAAGTVALALVGVFTGSFAAVGSGASRLVVDVLTTPLRNGLPFTVMLLATATAAWLWLGRPRRGRGTGGAPGQPGTVRPADAVPPSTVQPSAAQPQPPQQRASGPYGPSTGQQGQSGQQPPWAPPPAH
ncbi:MULTISPECIES: hypothetical protein [unclassified Curtobacterium]|uniref:hypothetical protein n=1 Tax=unclassified Curtobacterium TaxID=257496 RepID=UPI0008DD9D73|nr:MULTISPECIES: hypothetical protein [unclassified Curtobacterium]OIH98956.1 hypothetical protein BIU92_11770 [Curtobacterium sp. MCBA15_003]OII09451.1 hypothetical protein BIU97_13190 [Curtobacterium sp. MCBA15_009]OII31141.1 hypothetical protein BIU94_05655 [Curtobacterium sp. MMLR14_006]